LQWIGKLLLQEGIKKCKLYSLLIISFEKMFAKTFTRFARSKTAFRRFSADHHHAPPKEGFEGFVRKYLPEDRHVSLLG
jgi:hypothetical protein